jgi:hypothetical protein
MAMADISIRMPEALMSELQRAATTKHRSAEELAQEAVERYLRLKRRDQFYAFGEGQAARLGIREGDVPRLVKEARQTTERGR